MVFKGSRYANTAVVTPPAPDGSTPRVLSAREIGSPPGVLTHTAIEGERLDQLATRFYSESTKYWLILDANPDVLNPFELLQPGAPIQIPQNKLVRS